jgi:hypothetical protein
MLCDALRACWIRGWREGDLPGLRITVLTASEDS